MDNIIPHGTMTGAAPEHDEEGQKSGMADFGMLCLSHGEVAGTS